MSVMGIYWIGEFASNWFGEDTRFHKLIPKYIINFYISIQGVIIFVIFVCKRDVMSMLSKKYCPVLYYKFFAKYANESSKSCETEMRRFSRSSARASVSVNNYETEKTESLMNPRDESCAL